MRESRTKSRSAPLATGLLSLALLASLPAAATPARADEPESRPRAKIADVAWLAGCWEGEAFGGSFEETWNPPSAGSMVGLFKLRHGEEVAFYELETIVEIDGSLEFRVKHFEPDFVAWEEKEQYVAFPLAKIEKDAVTFEGLTLRRDGPDRIRGSLTVKTSEGTREEELVWRRRSCTGAGGKAPE